MGDALPTLMVDNFFGPNERFRELLLYFQEPKKDPQEEKTHRLKGPGVWDEPGAAHMGGKTPRRLSELCAQYMDNLEEYSLYQVK